MENSKESLVLKFLKYLDKEIAANINSNNKIVITVTEGHFLNKESKNYLYKFVLDNTIHPVDGISIEFISENIKSKGQIVQSFEQEITIAIADDIGKRIKNAKIEIKLTSILEILKNKIKEIYDNKKYVDYHVANHFFSGYNANDSFSNVMPGFENLINEYNQKKNTQNSENQEAVKYHFPENIQMLAHIIGSFIKIDMKVLLVSNSNKFIDEATVCLADTLIEDDMYKFGKIVNHVAQENNEIFAGHELVIPKRIIKKLKGLSENEKSNLAKKIKDIDSTLIELTQGLELIQKRNDNFSKVKQISKEIETSEQKIVDIEKFIKKQEKKVALFYNKLKNKENFGFIETLLIKLGLNPVKRKITLAQKELETKNQELSEIRDRCENLEKQRKSISDIMQNIHNELFIFLGKFNLTEAKLNEEYKSLISQREVIKTKITDLDTQFKLITSHVLSNAKMIGTTLNMPFLSNEFTDLHFDLLVVDESSLAAEPQLYWALCKCKMAAIIVGDYLKFVVPNSSLGV